MNYLKKTFWIVIVSLTFQCLSVSAADNPGDEEQYHTAEMYYEKAVKHYMEKEYDKAVENFSKVIDLIPNNTDDLKWTIKDSAAYFCRGTAYNDLGKYDKAIADFSSVIKATPNYNGVYFGRGVAYIRSEQYAEAIADFSHIIKSNPNYDDAYFGRGEAYFYYKQYDKAITDLTHAIKLTPNNGDIYIWRGLSYYSSEQYDKAIVDFSSSIELEPDNDEGFYRRGMAYSKLGQYDKAIKDFSMTHGVYAYLGQAETSSQQKQYGSAINYYSKAIEFLQADRTHYYPQLIACYLNIMELCIVDGKPDRFNYWLKQLDSNIPENAFSKDNVISKFYLILVNQCIMGSPLENIEKQLDGLLKKSIEPDLSFDLIDEWLNNPKNGLTQQQIKYIRSLTRKIKTDPDKQKPSGT